jgi:hypothetical protein
VPEVFGYDFHDLFNFCHFVHPLHETKNGRPPDHPFQSHNLPTPAH